ncbi:MAG: hypothetical protein KF686_11175 [Ramlibacter sp.]|nr:hypothetical protein [Ramlibacter sp.]
MKFILVLLVIVIAVFVWRSNRRDSLGSRSAARPAPPGAPQDMVRCPVCALHLPRADARVGRRGPYCSDEHRQQAEG